jgi:beta-lactamase regulating signal transducer with metallopeptidase domain
MAPNQYLQFAGIVLSYFLQVAAGYLVCLGLARILQRPDARFRVWIVFLLAAGAGWIALLFRAVRDMGALHSSQHAVAASAGSIRHWLIPVRWSQDVTISGRILLGLYLSALVAMACRKVWTHVRLGHLMSLGEAASPEIEALFAEVREELGVARCDLAVLPGLSSPATAYWWRPRVVLPEEAASQGASPQLASVFCHELTHVRRRDYFWSNLTDVLCGLLFFHPTVWQARNQLRLQRELACDLAVVTARPDFRLDYADNLARFVRHSIIRQGISCGVDFAASASLLGTRIRHILAEPAPDPWWKKFSATAASIALLNVFLLVFPQLSVGIDFAADAPRPAAASIRTAPHQAGVRHHTAAVVAHKHVRSDQAVGPQLQDSLRGVKTRSYLPETTAYRLSSGTYTPKTDSSPNWDSAAMSEPSPANPNMTPPTVGDSVTRVVLGTVGGVIIHERNERTERTGHR